MTAISKVIGRGADPDIINVINQDSKISPTYLAELTQTPAMAENIEDYIYQLKEAEDKRLLADIGAEITALATRKDSCTEEIRAELEKRITELETGGKKKYINAEELSFMMVNVFESQIKNNLTGGLMTGYRPFDDITGGLNKGELVIIGARPSIGKTSFALGMMAHQALNKHRVGFFSAEMDREQIGRKLVAGIGPIYLKILKTYECKNKLAEIIDILDRIQKTNIFLADEPNPKLSRVISTARTMKRVEGIEVLYVDYLSLIQVEGNQPHWEKVGIVSAAMKGLARELQIPVIVLSQVGRESEGAMPTLKDLRYSGAIEQDADIVTFIHRKRLSETPGDDRPTDIEVAKNRNGELGKGQIEFCKEISWFRNYHDKM